MGMTANSWSLSLRRHLSIAIVCVVIIASSLSIYNTPIVKSDLPGPYYVRGYINMNNNSSIPSGKTVTLTNTINGYNITTTTGALGSYQADVGKDSGMDCSDGNQIVVNCSYDSQVGENATNIDTAETFAWCNLSGGTRLENESLSINVTPWSWSAGTIGYSSYNSTSNTYFNFTNQGNVKINVAIHSENITWNGNKWNLTNITALNNFTLTYQKSSESTWTNINVTNSSFVTDLQYNSQYFSYIYWQLFGLNLSLPTSSSPEPSGDLSVNITYWSIKA